MNLAAGTRLGPYDLHSRLGGGGMGEVWKAYDPKLQRTVAIKVLHETDDAASRILAEARAASALNHPHICTIHDVGEADGQSFIVMEHVEGKPLSELIPSDGLPPESVIRYGTQIADALAHAHEHGVVHRDLKSANVVITPDGRAKVLDFGVADKLPDADAEALTQTHAAPLHAGTLVGTLAYMAPEVLQGDAALATSDIWALGVLLYEMASGRLPFGGTTQTAVIAAVVKDSPESLPTRVSAGLRTIVQRCLTKESRQRYGHASAVHAALEAIQSGTAEEASSSAPGPVASAGTSIAVLPFANMSADPEQEYFCDGIAEEITSALARVGQLRVAGRTSAFSFKGKSGDLREIGKTLDVGVVLEGSVRRAGDRLRITAQLVNVTDGYHLWSERFDRQMGDIFAVQEEIALAVVEALEVTLLGEERAAILKRWTENPEAYELCMRASHAWYQWTGEGLRTAVRLFQQALEKDSSYAVAHFGLGDCRAAVEFLGREPPDPSRIRTHLEAALRLDPDLAEAHAVLGWIVEGLFEWNWPSTESRCRKALALNPRSPHSLLVRGLLLAARGLGDESVAEMRRAVELDPLNPFLHGGLLQSLLSKRDWEGALRQARTTLDLMPDSWLILCFSGQACVASGLLDEAISTFERGVASSEGSPIMSGLLGNALAKAGRLDEARHQLEELHRRATAGYVSPLASALVYAGLDQRDDAFAALECTLDVHDVWLTPLLTYCPTLDDLRPDPRFADLRHRIGL